MFRASGLECVKGYHSLFQGIDISISPGEILQLKGSNGSGKTSLLKILTGLSQPESGQVFWNGTPIEDDPSYYDNLIYIGHLNGLKAELSALENLQLAQQYLSQGNDKAPIDALASVGLTGFEHILAHQLSAGQKRRVALARLFLNTASLWILDEPTTAIDVDGVKSFEQIVEAHTLNGGMVILSAHQALSFGAATVRLLSLS